MRARLTSCLAIGIAFAALSVHAEHTFEAKNGTYDFAFQAPEAGYVWLQFSQEPKDFKPGLQVLEPSDSLCVSDQCQARVAKGSVKMRLIDAWGRGATGPVTFNVLFSPERDRSEPNDTLVKARDVKLGEPFDLSIMPRGDQDWVAFEVEEPGYVGWTMEETKTPVSLTGCFYRAGKPALGEKLVRIDRPGRYYASFQDKYSAASSAEPLRITLTFTPEIDPLEPNDTPEKSATIDLDTWYTAAMAPSGDQDYFRVPVAEAGYLVCESSDAEVGLLWSLLTPQGEQSGHKNVLKVEPGECTIKLVASYNAMSLAPFAFRIRFLKQVGERSPAGATPRSLEFDTDYTVLLAQSGEVEHIRLRAPSRGVVRVETVTPPESALKVAIAQGEDPKLEHEACRIVEAGAVDCTFFHTYGGFELTPVVVRVRFEAEDDPSEPNDTLAQATALALGSRAKVLLSCKKDVDWYKVEVPADGTLYALASEVLEYEWHLSWEPQIELFAADGKLIKALYQSPRGPDRSAVVTRGTYWLKVYTHAWSDAERRAFYLSVDLASAAAEITPAPVQIGLACSFVGLEVDDATNAYLKILAASTGGTYVNAKESGQIERGILSAVVVAPAGAGEGGSFMPLWGVNSVVWILAGTGGLLLVLLLVFLRRRRR